MKVNIPVSLGELLDKISILEIKNQKIQRNRRLIQKSLQNKFNIMGN